MKKLIVVADWASDSLTCQEVRSATEGFLTSQGTPNITFVACKPSTVNTSYLLKQVVEVEERLGKSQQTVIFQNTDPRLSTEEKLDAPKGADFLVLRLQSGILVCGPNAGYNFSLLKDKIQVCYIYRNLNGSTQFRSRDLYSRVCAHLMDGLEEELELEEISVDVIPDLKGYFVGHIDNYGNIKTTIKQADLKGKYEFSQEVKITIGSVTHHATYVKGLFSGKVGELSIYPGSSGDKTDPFLEISIWTHFTEEEPHTGAYIFNHAKPGTEIVLS